MEAYIIDAVRSPRGAARDWGALAQTKPIELLRQLFVALEQRTDLDTALVEDIILGCVSQTGEQGGNLAKIAALYAGWSSNISGQTVNRFCTSGLTACSTAAARIMAGMEDIVVAGGIESMSRVAMFSDKGPWYSDKQVMAQTKFIHMGISGDLIATQEGFRREDVDAYALRSQRNAAQARDSGYFDRSIIAITDAEGQVILDKDQIIRADTTLEKLTSLEPSFAAIGAQGLDAIALQTYPELDAITHVHHGGNSPGMVDGAALLLFASAAQVKAQKLTPRARIISMANASVEPVVMLTAGQEAAKKALAKARLTPEDIDLYEVNEGFAAVALKFQRDFNLRDDQFNVNGGAIAMGHPLGASGAILLNSLLDELERQNKKRGLVALCGGAGVGEAMIIETLS
ncbi:acetyl-CoA C-acetyltransferase [Paremcibacter congregatus]|uniref:acetyl-CoA C-acetyltransferase n=1 Tax=Paremcibacter congregatus TaxID=2043170 RepID=UPI0030ECFCF9|tara:strand:+ start:1627 stop:2832 length:1206 start_codon:yes stop_codon:yes gene_type:complete